MDDPRELLLDHVKMHRKGFHVDEGPSTWIPNIIESICELMINIICDYIREERDTESLGMGQLERKYLCTEDFVNSEHAEEWIKMNPQKDDMGLIMYIYDNVKYMTMGIHRRSLLYLINMLYFYL
tara:strand:+ start:17 stop:391 length:375 start_codon:yes stop_codon:yes gene_type:complete